MPQITLAMPHPGNLLFSPIKIGGVNVGKVVKQDGANVTLDATFDAIETIRSGQTSLTIKENWMGLFNLEGATANDRADSVASGYRQDGSADYERGLATAANLFRASGDNAHEAMKARNRDAWRGDGNSGTVVRQGSNGADAAAKVPTSKYGAGSPDALKKEATVAATEDARQKMLKRNREAWQTPAGAGAGSVVNAPISK